MSKLSLNLGDLPPLLTVPEVAALLRTTANAIYLRIERGLMPGVSVIRDGRRRLLLRDDVLRYVQERAVSPVESRRCP
mgnify:CR=1 FL=1